MLQACQVKRVLAQPLTQLSSSSHSLRQWQRAGLDGKDGMVPSALQAPAWLSHKSARMRVSAPARADGAMERGPQVRPPLTRPSSLVVCAALLHCLQAAL